MNLRRETVTKAGEGDEQAMRELLQWWAWNDPNGTWRDALEVMDGADPSENPEGWDPMAVAGEVARMTLEHFADDDDGESEILG